MNKSILLFSLFFATAISSECQSLLPAINSGILPADSDPICVAPPFSGSFETNGYDVGDTIAQFTLFDLNSTAFDVQTELQNGKPVLLIAGSLTCPVFRNKVTVINDIITTYGSSLRTIVVYTIEAHPTDPSPYSGQVNLTQQNIDEGIYFAQPTTYLERKNMVDTLLDMMSISAPVFIDGPCNEWWLNFGPAPNNAYLIDTNGIVFSKHGWLDEYPKDIFCDIDSILGTTGNCNISSATGTFTLNILDTVGVGLPGSIIYTYAEIINNSADDAEVIVKKLEENYAPGWNASFCINGVCYLSSVDSTTVLVPAGDTILFSADFFTSGIEDTSNLKVGFRNLNFPSNQFAFRFYAYTDAELGVEELNSAKAIVFPNPASDGIFYFEFSENEKFTVCLYDLSGKMVYSENGTSKKGKISIATRLENGIYFSHFISGNKIYINKLIVQRN